MLRVSGVSSRSYRSCLESELRSAAQNALSSASALYRAWGSVGLSAIRPSSLVMTMILIGLGTGGCSFSRNDGGILAKGPFAKMDESDVTGSITSRAPTESDLAFARNAASDVLSQGDKDASQHWENPETGARGSVTPIAQSYAAEDGRKCRDFLASYVNGRTESWLQGAGCQSGHGRWEIHTLKPWRS
ncbi:RT0821/Lpp0805 family surface protein [Bradyrhizobium sp. UFLA05-109]